MAKYLPRSCPKCRSYLGIVITERTEDNIQAIRGQCALFETENGTARAMAKLLDEECDPNDRIAWQAGTPTDWGNESLSLTIEYVYPLPETHEISEDYVKRAMPILHRRLIQAGVRLA
jgi:hypothetical protein